MPRPFAARPVRPPAALLVAAVAAVALMLLAGPAASSAAPAGPSAAEVALAERYAPVVRLPGAPRGCEDGDLYEPVDVDVLMGNPEVALRGPWDDVNIVTVGPGADEIGRGLPGYKLDFPGDALRPDCTFEEWSARLNGAGRPPTVYARVAGEPAAPGRLALQYWLYYVFNDWKNTHEGDWELIQLNFDAGTPEEALARDPVEVGYSQHSSGERAAWGAEKLELVDGTHPVVYPAQGSHANFFSSDLFLMGSRAEGVGCDDTRDPARTVRPALATVPGDPAAARAAFPWLGFEGRWGEEQSAFFNAPLGPAQTDRWRAPLTWAREDWRDQSLTVPASGLVGTAATDFFCGAVGTSSTLLRRALANPLPVTLAVAALLLVVAWGLSRTRWRPAEPVPIARRREWGRLVSGAGALFARHPRAFLGIGLLYVPLGLLVTGLQWLLFRASALDPLVDAVGERNPFVAALALGLGALAPLLAFSVVLAATARVMVDVEAGRPARALAGYRGALRHVSALLPALALAVVVLIVLTATLVLLPVAAFLLVRWSLLGAVAGVEGGTALADLRRSAALVQGHWWRTAVTVIGVGGLALLTGPAVGVLVLLFTGAAFDLVNLIAAIVYVVSVPFAAIVVSYLYFDLRARAEEAPAGAAAPGPAVTAS